jgi:hypothetical protein
VRGLPASVQRGRRRLRRGVLLPELRSVAHGRKLSGPRGPRLVVSRIRPEPAVGACKGVHEGSAVMIPAVMVAQPLDLLVRPSWHTLAVCCTVGSGAGRDTQIDAAESGVSVCKLSQLLPSRHGVHFGHEHFKCPGWGGRLSRGWPPSSPPWASSSRMVRGALDAVANSGTCRRDPPGSDTVGRRRCQIAVRALGLDRAFTVGRARRW